MTETKDLMKKSADLTDYQPLQGYRSDLLRDGALHPSPPHFDSKHHLILQ